MLIGYVGKVLKFAFYVRGQFASWRLHQKASQVSSSRKEKKSANIQDMQKRNSLRKAVWRNKIIRKNGAEKNLRKMTRLIKICKKKKKKEGKHTLEANARASQVSQPAMQPANPAFLSHPSSQRHLVSHESKKWSQVISYTTYHSTWAEGSTRYRSVDILPAAPGVPRTSCSRCTRT